MKALMIDAMPAEGRGIAEAVRQEAISLGMEVVTLGVGDMSIKRCIGCFSCWVKTPGVCVLDDDGRRIAMEWPDSDIVVYVTPVFLGSYSPEMKKQLDRLIPVLLPYFKKFDGEIHHPQRYPKRKALVAFGQLASGGEEGRTFEELVRRNSLNLQTRFCETMTFGNDMDRAAASALLERAKEAVA
jgi:multimeric flavodoxin WrbA